MKTNLFTVVAALSIFASGQSRAQERAIAVFLHPSNPVESLTVEQLGSIYATGGKTESWSEFSEKAQTRKIRRAGRANNSGTFAAFREMVAPAGFRESIAAMRGSAAVMEFVTTTEDAIAFFVRAVQSIEQPTRSRLAT